jgi:hypothetical protein
MRDDVLVNIDRCIGTRARRNMVIGANQQMPRPVNVVQRQISNDKAHQWNSASLGSAHDPVWDFVGKCYECKPRVEGDPTRLIRR